MPSIARKTCLWERTWASKRKGSASLSSRRLRMLEAVRDAYRDQDSYLPAVRAIEKFRTRIIRT